MSLYTPYSLPYSVLFEKGSLMSARQDVQIRITLSKDVTPVAVDSLDAMVLPFFLLATSGALAGENISPWTSTIEDKSNPIVKKSAVEWLLKSCNLDERSLVVFSQMLLSIHEECSIREVMFSISGNPQTIQQLTINPRINDPYPGIWRNLEFSSNIDEEISTEVSIHATFSETLLKEAQDKVEAEISSWIPGLVSGAYGVAPVLPSECVGIPDNEMFFIDNELEWHISRVLAHPSAFKGLVNTFASISYQIMKIDKLLIE